MNPLMKLRRGDQLVRDGIRFKVLSRSKNGHVNLQKVDDDTLSSVTDAVLIEEWTHNRLEIDRRQEALSERAQGLLDADVEDLPPKGKVEAERRLHFVREMLKGGRRRWANAALQDLIDRVAAEQGISDPPSPRSLRRWATRAEGLGFRDLADVRILVPRNHACGGAHDKFGAEVQSVMEGVIDDLVMVREASTGADAHLELGRLIGLKEAELRERLKDPSITLTVPSLRTFYRRLGEISDEQRTLATEGKLQADLKHSLVGLGPQGEYLLHEVEIDHTTLDVIVVCPLTDVPIGRPTITAALDRWSRMIIGIHIGLEAPGWRSVMLCLRNAILPKADLLARDPEDLRARHAWLAMGLMRTLVLNNAPEFHCAALRNAAIQFGIILQFCPAGQPHYKAKIERWFRRLNVELIHTFPGTTFSNPQHRGKYDSKAEACLTLDELRALVHRWVVDVYSQKPHTYTKQSPAERWEEGLRLRGGVVLPPSVSDVMLGLAEVEYRRLTRKGIELYGLHYSDRRNPDLREMLNHPDCPRAVKVRIDPDNLGTIHVEDFRTPGRYVPVPCTDPAYAEGMTLTEHHVVTARVRVGLKVRQTATMAMLAQAKADIRADVARLRQSGKLTSKNLNGAFPPPTGKVIDVDPDGLPATPSKPSKRPHHAWPALQVQPPPKFEITFE